jgi:hypothetical protein
MSSRPDERDKSMAIKLVKNLGYARSTLFQMNPDFRMTYPEARRTMDFLEKTGIIEPFHARGKITRKVLLFNEIDDTN